MVGTLEAEVALSAADRCDRCGAQAIARATLSSGRTCSSAVTT